MGEKGIFVNGVPLEEHIAKEESGELTKDAQFDYSGTVAHCERTIYRGPRLPKTAFVPKHSRGKTVPMEKLREGWGMKGEAQSLQVLKVLLQADGPMFVDAIAPITGISRKNVGTILCNYGRVTPQIKKIITSAKGGKNRPHIAYTIEPCADIAAIHKSYLDLTNGWRQKSTENRRKQKYVKVLGDLHEEYDRAIPIARIAKVANARRGYDIRPVLQRLGFAVVGDDMLWDAVTFEKVGGKLPTRKKQFHKPTPAPLFDTQTEQVQEEQTPQPIPAARKELTTPQKIPAGTYEDFVEFCQAALVDSTGKFHTREQLRKMTIVEFSELVGRKWEVLY